MTPPWDSGPRTSGFEDLTGHGAFILSFVIDHNPSSHLYLVFAFGHIPSSSEWRLVRQTLLFERIGRHHKQSFKVSSPYRAYNEGTDLQGPQFSTRTLPERSRSDSPFVVSELVQRVRGQTKAVI